MVIDRWYMEWKQSTLKLYDGRSASTLTEFTVDVGIMASRSEGVEMRNILEKSKATLRILFLKTSGGSLEGRQSSDDVINDISEEF